MKLIYRYIKPYLGRMGIGMLIKFTGTIMDLFLPWILSYLIDDIAPTKDQNSLFYWGGVMLVCSVLAITFNVLANRMASSVARDATETLRHELFSRIIYLSNKQVDSFTIPSLISRMTTDTYYIHRMIGMMQRIGLRAPILLIGGIIMSMTLDPVLSGILCAVLPFMGLLVYLISKKSVPLFRSLQQAVDKMVRIVRENASGVRVIKALSRQEYEKERFEQANTTIMERENNANYTMAALNPIMNFLLNLGLILVLLAGAFRVNSGLTETGEIIAFLSYFTIILNAMLSVTRVITMYSTALASAARIQEVMDTESDMHQEEKTTLPDRPLIRFDHVTFSYNGVAPDISDITFDLKKGESLGIIGPTGSGKSTIAKLLLRFYDIQSGEAEVDGRNLKGYKLEELRSRFGVVFQNDAIFRDTVRGNICLDRNISEESLKCAVQTAQASQFIEEAGGLEAKLEAGGANLSGGQRQRVLLSRALSGNPEILILDDSTSALDYQTEAELFKALREHYSDLTRIIIAQRISSVRRCDRILVLEDGKVLGYGTHDELKNTCPYYQELCSIQMGEEVEA